MEPFDTSWARASLLFLVVLSVLRIWRKEDLNAALFIFAAGMSLLAPFSKPSYGDWVVMSMLPYFVLGRIFKLRGAFDIGLVVGVVFYAGLYASHLIF